MWSEKWKHKMFGILGHLWMKMVLVYCALEFL